MSVKTINLESAVAWVKSKLRDLLDDPVDLFERLDRAVQVAQLSASEGYQAVGAACCATYDCAEIRGDAELMEKWHCIAQTFRNDLRVWYDCAYHNECAARKLWHDPNIRDSCVAKWESRGGKYQAELRHGPYDYYYIDRFGCASVCNPNLPVESAVLVMQSMLDRGRFLPDNAKLPMKRVL